MNSIYNNNIEALKLRLDVLYEHHKEIIDAYKNNNANLVKNYEIIKGLKIQTAKNGSITAGFENKFLHSSYNPESQAKKNLNNEAIEKKDITVFLGLGLGYEALAFVDSYPEKMLILIEPEIEKLLWAFSYIDFTPIFAHQKLIGLFAATPKECINLLEHFGIDTAFFIKNETHALGQEDFFLSLSVLIERNIQKKEINDSTLERFGKLWLKNTIKNSKAYIEAESIDCLEKIHKGEKTLILAAGPSLDETLPFLPKLAEKMIIICVDTALQACLRAGIEPDYLITIDPQYWNAMHIRHLKTKNTKLITEISSYPSAFRFPCKEIFLTSSIYPLGSLIEKKLEEKGFQKLSSLNPGGSVATSAWEFARLIGSEQIFFAGLDLGFPENKTHAKGSSFEKNAYNNTSRLSPFSSAIVQAMYSAPSLIKENYKGEKILSDTRMQLYAWWFESKIEKEGIKTFVLSKAGMKIPGIDFYNVDELLKEKNIDKKIKNISKKTPSNNLEKKEALNTILIEINENIEKDLEIVNNALAFSKTNLKNQTSHLEKLKEKIKLSPLYPIIPLAGKTERQIRKYAQEKAEKEKTAISQSQICSFFQNTKEALIFLQNLLNKA